MTDAPLNKQEQAVQQAAIAESAEGTTGQACWNRIGVYGDHSCPELQTFTHCRNCPIHSEAAAQLLNRTPPPGYRHAWTEHYAQVKSEVAPGKISALVFRVNLEWLGLPAQALHEISPSRPIHSLPHRRRGIVRGLVNIRGELLVCASLGALLGMEARSQSDTSRIGGERLLVAGWEGSRLVFPVDEVHGLHRFDSQQITDPPATVAKASVSFTRGIFAWRERSVGFLDPGLLFSALNRSLA